MNLYLTEIRLDYEAAVKAGLRDSYQWHQKIWLCFPGRKEAQRDFLTRLDPRDDHFRLLLLSATAPHRPPWCPEPAWRSKLVPPEFLDAPSFRFSLLANPTRKTRFDKAGNPVKHGCRVPIFSREDFEDGKTGKLQPGLLSWLARKAETHGFAVNPDLVEIFPRPRQYFIKSGVLGLHEGVEFRGVLQVRDRDAFRNAFTHGIGSAKAFGFGMLVLAPQ